MRRYKTRHHIYICFQLILQFVLGEFWLSWRVSADSHQVFFWLRVFSEKAQRWQQRRGSCCKNFQECFKLFFRLCKLVSLHLHESKLIKSVIGCWLNLLATSQDRFSSPFLPLNARFDQLKWKATRNVSYRTGNLVTHRLHSSSDFW